MAAGPRNHLYRTHIRLLDQALRIRGKPHHVRDLADQLDLEPDVGRHDDDALDQAAQLYPSGLGRLDAANRVPDTGAIVSTR